jgi:hypothetical protein
MRVSIDSLKKHSPGVPSNTCPYIDEAIRIIQEIEEAYSNFASTGISEPLFDKRCALAIEHLEYVRDANEVLRDNSYYWYTKCKNMINSKKK